VLFRAVQNVADQTSRSLSVRPPPSAASPGDSDLSSDRSRDGTQVRVDGGGIERDESIRRLVARLPPNAQVVVCTPLLDNWPVSLARALAARGHPQLFVSPDVLAGTSHGKRVGAIYRRLRLHALERAGANTVTWHPDQPIDYALRLSLPHLFSQR